MIEYNKSLFNSWYVLIIKHKATMNVKISATGKDHNKPSNPIKIGMIIGNRTPRIISRVKETIVDDIALPSDCKM